MIFGSIFGLFHPQSHFYIRIHPMMPVIYFIDSRSLSKCYRESNGRKSASWSNPGICSHSLTWPIRASPVVASITTPGLSDISLTRASTSSSLRAMLRTWDFTVSDNYLDMSGLMSKIPSWVSQLRN